MKESDLIHDWNTGGDEPGPGARARVELDDETLRDGLQSPSVLDPDIAAKIEILHLMALVLAHEIAVMLRDNRPFDRDWYEQALRALPELPDAP